MALVGLVLGGIIGAAAFASIAAVVAPGAWSNVEAGVIGFWTGAACGLVAWLVCDV